MTRKEDAYSLSQHGTSVAGVIAIMVKDNDKINVEWVSHTITGEQYH